MKTSVTNIFWSALGFGGWPVLIVWAGADIRVGSLLLLWLSGAMYLAIHPELIRKMSEMTPKMVIVVILAAALNTKAMEAFAELMRAAELNGKKSGDVAIAQSLMPVVYVLGAAFLLNLILKPHHAVGLVVIAVGIYIFSR